MAIIPQFFIDAVVSIGIQKKYPPHGLGQVFWPHVKLIPKGMPYLC